MLVQQKPLKALRRSQTSSDSSLSNNNSSSQSSSWIHLRSVLLIVASSSSSSSSSPSPVSSDRWVLILSLFVRVNLSISYHFLSQDKKDWIFLALYLLLLRSWSAHLLSNMCRKKFTMHPTLWVLDFYLHFSFPSRVLL